MSDDFNTRLREDLRNTEKAKSTRLERRIERKGQEVLEFHEMLTPKRKNPVVTTFVTIINFLGIIAATIPMLLYFAITTVPAYLGFLLFSGF